jgi:spermidine/putrescine transport system permease protein
LLSLRSRRRLFPWLLLAPGLIWLLVFYLIPSFAQAWVSLWEGSLEEGYAPSWAFHTYPDAISGYGAQFGRSFLYAGIATVA